MCVRVYKRMGVNDKLVYLLPTLKLFLVCAEEDLHIIKIC